MVAALLPLMWTYFSAMPGSPEPSIWQLFGNGDVYIISVVLMMAGLTEIVLLLDRIAKLSAIGLVLGGVILAMLNAAKYAGVMELMANSHETAAMVPHSVTLWSISLFVLAVFHSTVCVRLAAGAE